MYFTERCILIFWNSKKIRVDQNYTMLEVMFKLSLTRVHINVTLFSPNHFSCTLITEGRKVATEIV